MLGGPSRGGGPGRGGGIKSAAGAGPLTPGQSRLRATVCGPGRVATSFVPPGWIVACGSSTFAPKWLPLMLSGLRKWRTQKLLIYWEYDSRGRARPSSTPVCSPWVGHCRDPGRPAWLLPEGTAVPDQQGPPPVLARGVRRPGCSTSQSPSPGLSRAGSPASQPPPGQVLRPRINPQPICGVFKIRGLK